MIKKKILDRQINVGSKLNSIYYSNEIIKTYYESSESLNRYKIDLHGSPNLNRYNFLNFSQDGNYMATASFLNLLFWNINTLTPTSMKIETQFGTISNAVFNEDSSKIICSGYNFLKENESLQVSDTVSGKIIKSLNTCSFIKDFSLSPVNSSIIIFANKSKIFSCDLRCSTLNKIKIKNLEKRPYFSSLQYHPIQDNMILTSSQSEADLFTFDIRNGEVINNYEIPFHNTNKFHVYYSKYFFARYNKRGTQILVSKVDENPILFNSEKSRPIYEFDEFGYCSAIRGRYSCFAGVNDEYIAAGSRNFNVYMWKIPKKNTEIEDEIILRKINKAKFVFNGHTSEVRAIRYNYSKSFLASIGFNDRLIFWSPFPICSNFPGVEKNFSNDTRHETNLRYNYSSISGIDSYWGRNTYLRCIFFASNGYRFCYYLKKVLNMKTKLIEKFFERNPSIQFIYSLIYQFETIKKLTDFELLNKFKEVLQENPENSIIPYLHNLSFYFEVKKVFETKCKIKASIVFLKLHINLTKKNKKKIKFLNKKKPALNKIERLESLERITLVMKAMLYDLMIIFKQSKELYVISFQILKKILTGVDRSHGIELYESRFLECIFKEGYIEQSNELSFINEQNDSRKNEENSLIFCKSLRNFCAELSHLNININNTKKFFNLYDYYDDVVLSELKNNLMLKHNFKRDFESLK